MAGRLQLIVGAMLLAAVGCGESLVEYRDEEGRFTLRLPAPPAEAVDLPLGVKLVRLSQQSGTYSVAWEDVSEKGPKLTAEERLDAFCDGAVAARKAKQLSRRPITLPGDYTGRELIFVESDGRTVIHDRMYLVKGRLYHVVAQGSQWWVESSTARKVLDSFRVIEE